MFGRLPESSTQQAERSWATKGIVCVIGTVGAMAFATMFGQPGCEGPRAPTKKPTPTVPRPNEEPKHRVLPEERPKLHTRDLYWAVERNAEHQRTVLLEMENRRFQICTPLPEGAEIHDVQASNEEICLDVSMGSSSCIIVIPASARREILSQCSCSSNKEVTFKIPYTIRMPEQPAPQGILEGMEAIVKSSINVVTKESAGWILPKDYKINVKEVARKPLSTELVSIGQSKL